jgi:3-hydroxy acid dehydrogenase / malonic semialdehyde reductase
MPQTFVNKTILITGASAGFGAETARLFAREGARLILVARREDKLKLLEEELRNLHHVETLSIILDVSNSQQVEERLRNLPSPFDEPDILINNAGLVRGMDKSWEVTAEQWDEMIDTNVKGVLNVSRQILPKMLKANKGHIINIGSTSGHGTYPGGSVYCATKFALRALTDTLRMELVATPIRVSLISPGMAETEFSKVRFYGDEQKAKDVYKGIKALEAVDIAETILFVASRPPHVNIGDIIIYPKNQASATLIYREG